MAAQNLQAVAFPTLSDDQLEALGHCPHTTRKRFRDGETLIEAGDRNFRFFVVISGAIEIIDVSGDQPKTITVHHPGQFSGDVSHLTGRPSIIRAVARGDCEAFEVSSESLKHLLNNCPNTGDIILNAFMARRQLLHESASFAGLRVIGSRDSQDTFRIRDFLALNRVPATWVDLNADPAVKELLERFGVTEADTPVVAWGGKLLLRNPSNRELADALGLRQMQGPTAYDLVVVGAGPAGLAAAVYGASEGLNTVVLECMAPGGQAGRSMRIDNYLGFPTGITGSELADRAVIQANKFGARLPVATQVVRMTFDKNLSIAHLDDGATITAKCLIIATGAEYRLLGVEGCERFEGRGIYYAATPIEAQMCWGADVIVVGGGNSAGQACVFLAGQVRKVYLVIRGPDVRKNMSSYLVERVTQIPNIEICLNSEVRRLSGDDHLGEVEISDTKTSKVRTVQTAALFSFIGATPRTDWLPPEIERDDKDFVSTGPAVASSRHWTSKRPPFLLETSRAGVFAAGDVRSGSVKRVSSAVGEGSMAVQFVHEYLKQS